MGVLDLSGDGEITREAILETFLAESEEGLATMEAALLALESQPADEELLRAVSRVVHTIKGSASCLSLTALPELTHTLEDTLDIVRGAKTLEARVVTELLATVDLLRFMVREVAAGNDRTPPSAPGVLARLLAAVQGNGTAEPTAAVEPSPVHSPAEGTRVLRVDVDTLDRLLNLTGEIAISRARLAALIERTSADNDALEPILEAHREADRLFVDLQEYVMKARMVHVGPVLRPLARTVRDVSRAHGKEARLLIEGEDIIVDTKIIHGLRDGLVHMLRNALDHGIEAPEVRRAAGKEPCGTLTLRVRQERGTVVVELSDDGAGFDRTRILERAKSLGVVREQDVLTDDEVCRLVFRAGLSTAETVNDMSGRGVGMDVVLKDIEALRGTVAIRSEQGKGSTVTIRVPLTLAIIDAFAVEVAGEAYIVPMDAVTECLDLPPGVPRDAATGLARWQDRTLRCVRLRRLFGLHGSAPRQEAVVVVQLASGAIGLVVDTLVGEMQAVVKPLGRSTYGATTFSACTILGDGRVAMILDVSTLLPLALTIERESFAESAGGGVRR
jgi:two-component system chemotaxis sensor kinase CheA